MLVTNQLLMALPSVKPLQVVCLVDDTAEYRFLVEAIFTRYMPAYRLHLFDNGQGFLDVLPELGELIDLVILDQHMPGLSGYQTLLAIRRETNYSLLPVVMMSSDASHSEIKSFYEAGATSYLPKQMDFDALKESLLAACQYASKA